MEGYIQCDLCNVPAKAVYLARTCALAVVKAGKTFMPETLFLCEGCYRRFGIKDLHLRKIGKKHAAIEVVYAKDL